VSYVLNDTPHQAIPETTRRRVLEAAAELGYTPSAAARALRSGRSDVVLALLPDWPIGPTVGALIEQLSAQLARKGLTFVVHPYARGGRAMSEVWKAITPAAVVTFAELDQREAATMRAAGVGLTVALFGGTGVGSHVLEVPEERAGRLQAEHLAAAGHRRLGYAFPDDERVLTFSGPRLDGARQACAELGMDEPMTHTVALSAESAAVAINAWRQVDPPVTAVCAYNDEVALAVLAGLRELGLTAPDDLAVIGVDDIPAASLAAPPLTTVKPDMAKVAQYIADTITQRSDDLEPPLRPNSTVHTVMVRGSA
jgi:DNA-binding LacI/PurR family transcriptional regulator